MAHGSTHELTPRERAELRAAERASEARAAEPWRLALAVVFALWVGLHAWLWLQRGVRPRIDGLDDLLTIARALTAGAFLWVLLYTPLAWLARRVGARVRSRLARRIARDGSGPRHRDGHAGDEVEPGSPGHERATLGLTLASVLAALVLFGGSTAFAIGFALYVPLGVVAITLLGLLPWLPVVWLLHRAFPQDSGGRGELVMAGLLLFFAVGLAQSWSNRGFYEWRYSNAGIEFRLPPDAIFQER